MSDPEGQVERLAPGASPNSFRVLAEWLRDNRRILEKRMDSQDQKLEEIHEETKRTNGRVSDLEHTAELASALADGKETVLEDLEKAKEREDARRGGKRSALINGAFIVCAGSVGALVQHFLG